jgi:cyclohexyl-isocyanide hydratase
MSHDMLVPFGAIAVDERVVVDGNIITGGGVTAGIDFALHIAALLAGEDVARTIQLGLEYDPAPPFGSGHPRSCDPALVDRVRASAASRQEQRRHAVIAAAAALK